MCPTLDWVRKQTRSTHNTKLYNKKATRPRPNQQTQIQVCRICEAFPQTRVGIRACAESQILSDTPGRLTTKAVWVNPSSKTATEALPVLTTTDQSRRRGNAAVDRGMPAAVTSRSARQPSSKANAAGLCFYLRGMRPLTIGPGSFKPTGEVSRSSEENTG